MISTPTGLRLQPAMGLRRTLQCGLTLDPLEALELQQRGVAKRHTSPVVLVSSEFLGSMDNSSSFLDRVLKGECASHLVGSLSGIDLVIRTINDSNSRLSKGATVKRTILGTGELNAAQNCLRKPLGNCCLGSAPLEGQSIAAGRLDYHNDMPHMARRPSLANELPLALRKTEHSNQSECFVGLNNHGA
jgi:hypothetical protein